ncbi:MAG: hypothetical protein M1828_007512 [Chrysothrix sp. TS-e1954]|nr:MAG: hypothetical protein M1828_007512 [Chrysothrix sp. TS-e1954]
MRVAIAGTGGLAYWIAHHIQAKTGHQLVFLSRNTNPTLGHQGFQVLVVDYNDRRSLEFALTGIDVVISTVPGTAQINLIDAAVRARVRRFASAEFEGRPSARPSRDALDRGKAQVLQHLERNRSRLESTVFVCGVLYERFAPGGMFASNIGLGSYISGEGDYMINARTMTAEVPYSNGDNQLVRICMTAASDVGRFIMRSLEIQRWPTELIMSGENMTTFDLLSLIARVRGRSFEQQNVVYYNPNSLAAQLTAAQRANDVPRQYRLINLTATQNGRHHYTQSNLNAAFPDVTPLRFEQWFSRQWADH